MAPAKIIVDFKSDELAGKELGGYCRISKDEDRKNYATILSQQAIISYYVESRGGKIAKWYIDDNISGYGLDRPAFNEMLDDLGNGTINGVASKDLSRVGRHNALVLLFLQNLKEVNKQLIAIDDNYDSFRDDDDVIGIKTWYNERYVKDISKKIKSNIQNKMREGKYMSALLPYGYP